MSEELVKLDYTTRFLQSQGDFPPVSWVSIHQDQLVVHEEVTCVAFEGVFYPLEEKTFDLVLPEDIVEQGKALDGAAKTFWQDLHDSIGQPYVLGVTRPLSLRFLEHPDKVQLTLEYVVLPKP